MSAVVQTTATGPFDRPATPAQGDAAHAAEHPPHLAHHFDTPVQQFEAAKFGMWLFIATEFLLFGGLFCLYAVFRHGHPEVFKYGAKFLQTNWGALNTIVLILSSMTMALAVRCAQLNQRRPLAAFLGLTILGGAVFMGVKFVEYRHKFHENLVWGQKFYEEPHAALLAEAGGGATPAAAPSATPSGDPVKGQVLWMGTCRTCHGPDGSGITGQGKDIRGSKFIAGKTDKELVAFVKGGRMPFDTLNTTGIQMPPKGGNPMFKDEDLFNIVSFVRSFKAPEAPPIGAAAPEGAATAPAGTGPGPPATAPVAELYISKSVVPYALEGPAGLAANWDVPRSTSIMVAASHAAAPDPRRDSSRPANAHMFFGLYFMMTGLHGLHVLVGMVLISWLLVRSLAGHFSSAYFTPVDLVGLYWHVVDIIWIFLFPLLYLIH